ncbi:predicted protein [Chaetoceros tenuissimus]|uniref:Uncharacterized protein n=1 Tax=Chaetoceros tenuissimus TaxID=426638 RepID=A0AAD3HBM6_9STRA|nr:predicted protein [Chaetoceros tenuissimus]
MNQSNPSDERPNRKARKADNKYKAKKRKAAAIFEVAETKRGKIFNEKLAKKKDERIGTFHKCLNDTRLANPTNHALPQGEDQEMVQIKIEDKVFDVLVLNFKDGKLLQGIQEYERFEMSKGCWTIYWRKHLNRNSECKALKGKHYGIKVDGRMIAIHLRDVLPDKAKQGVRFMEKLHCAANRQECLGKTCGAEGFLSPTNIANYVLQDEECLKKLGLTKRDPDAKFRLVVKGKSTKVYVPMKEEHWTTDADGKLVTEVAFQIGNLMNRNIYGTVPQIKNLTKSIGKEDNDFPRWDNTIFGASKNNIGVKLGALNEVMVKAIKACHSLFPHKTASHEFEDGNQSIACNFLRKRSDKIAMHKDTPSGFPCCLVNNRKNHGGGGELFLAEAAFTSNYIDGDLMIMDGESLHGVYSSDVNQPRFSMVVYNNGKDKEEKNNDKNKKGKK